MDKWLQRGLVLRLLSLVLAFVLWFMVNEPTLPFALNRTSTTVTGIDVEPRYDKKKYQLLQMKHKVDLVLIGEKETIVRLPMYHVFVDLTKLSAGKHPAVPVQIEGLPSGIQVRPTPGTIPVEIAEKAKRDIPIDIHINGSLPVGYQLLPISYEPTHVRVLGIKQEVDKVQNITAFINLSKVYKTVVEMVPLTIHGRSGNKPKVKVVPQKVKVTIPVHEIGVEIPLSVKILKPPPNGYQVETITLRPAKVTLYGDSQAINAYKTYPGIQLDLSKVTSDRTFLQDVVLVAPVKKVTPTKVEIYVRMRQTPIFR